MLNLLDCKIDVYDCGSFVPPKLEVYRISSTPARRLDSGQALDQKLVDTLYSEGRRVGGQLAASAKYIVIGECVPGGTTTALGVLRALGYPADKLVSSSMPSTGHHDLRGQLVEEGIKKSGLTEMTIRRAPLRAVAAVGDPMQPFVAGLALAASHVVPVVLGGGTQMLAVYALARAIVGDAVLNERALAVITTKWVAFDRFANPAELAALVGAPFAASVPDFGISRHSGLRAYEEGNVKEGVGAGAMMALAHLGGFSPERIHEAIDLQYDRMVTSKPHH